MKPPRPIPAPEDVDSDPDDRLASCPEPSDEGDEPSDLDDVDQPFTDADDSRWDVFIPDDDQLDPLPDVSDYWHEFPDDE
jgi:hypothetical protein